MGVYRISRAEPARFSDIYHEPYFSKRAAKCLYDMSFGTLYPVFHKLRKKVYLQLEEVNVNGKIRKYYSITEEGNRILEESKVKIKELFNELFEK